VQELIQRWRARHGDDAIWARFDTGSLERGLDYAERGFVLDWTLAGTSLYARVKGSGRQVYYTQLQAQDVGAASPVRIACTCPLGSHCKHGIAALASYLDSLDDAADGRLDPELELWLSDLAGEAQRASDDGRARDQLIYIVAADHRRGLRVDVYKTRRRKDGGYGKLSPYTRAAGTGARFLEPADERLLPLVNTHLASVDAACVPLVLRELAAVDRAHLGRSDGPALRLGPERAGSFQWGLRDDGQQRLMASVADAPEAEVVAGLPPWYLDPASGEAGPLNTGLAPRMAMTCLTAPAVAPEAVAELRGPLAEMGADIPLPEEPSEESVSGVTPIPHLWLGWRPIEPPDPARDGDGPTDLPVAMLAFDYRGFEVSANDGRRQPCYVREGTLWRVERDPQTEASALERLGNAGLERWYFGGEPVHMPSEPGEWLTVVLETLPALEAEGWRITMTADFPYRVVTPDDWHAEISTGEGWFDLALDVEIDGERHPLVPLLVQLIQSEPEAMSQQHLDQIDADASLMLQLADGRMVPVPAARVVPMLRTLIELYDPKRDADSATVALPTARAGALAELDESVDMTWQGDTSALDFGHRLAQLERVEPAAPPTDLRATLRDYQRLGVGWLQTLGQQGLGGVLADDMGLGKTLQVLAHLLLEREQGRPAGPSLVVAPLSLLFNWEREAERFAPELRVRRLHGPGRHADHEHLGAWDLVLTTYNLVARDIDALAPVDFHLVVLDEAQAVKNPQAKTAQAVRRLSAHQRLCLTGTPLENHLGELWAQFDFLLPGLLGDRHTFNRLFRRPIERDSDATRQDALKRRIQPFLLRRSKQAIAEELPAKTEIQREAELTGEQRDLYETVRASMEDKVRQAIDQRGLAQSQVVVLDALLKLRQVCCDPRLLSMEAAQGVRRSAKLDLLMGLIDELRSEDRRILLFSQFTSMLGLIEDALAGTGIDYVKLTGQTKKREERVARFQNGEVPLFLVSLRAGGTGLNLTAADTVIHYDPWWNPAVMDQATDRAHRIGQDQPVFAYHLVTRGTVEERIMALQRRKAELGAWLLGGEGGSTAALEMADVEALFQPLE
jgi:hypothetical protein